MRNGETHREHRSPALLEAERAETSARPILDRARDIERVDLTPDHLVRRVREGKLYLPHDEKGDTVRAGTSLGPAARRFVEAMGGTLSAANHADGISAAFTSSLLGPLVAHALEGAA